MIPEKYFFTKSLPMNNLSYFDWLPLGLYPVLLLYMGLRARRKKASQEEFLLSGRSLTLPAFVATLVTTWYGGILGVGEFTYTYGVSVWFVFGLPYYLFALLFAFTLAGRIRTSDIYSIPDMFYRKYGRKSGLLGSAFLMIITSPAPYILMLGVLLQEIAGLPFILAVFIGTLFSMIYIWWGGFRSVVQTDKLQFILMFAGFIILFIFLACSELSVGQLFSVLDKTHKSPLGEMSWQELVVWISIAAWTFIDPGFHQRCAAAKSPKVARNGILVSVVFWFVFDMLTLMTGLYAYVLLPDINPVMSFPLLAFMILPPLLKGFFITGLLAIIMSTIDSYSFLSALTFGRDLLGRWKRSTDDDERVNRWVRWGLLFTALVAVGLILLVPSVIGLWYHLGSLFLPPLLLPVLGSYFPGLKVNSGSAFGIMILSFSMAITAYLWGQFDLKNGQPAYPLDVQPFFWGMFGSVLGWMWRRGK